MAKGSTAVAGKVDDRVREARDFIDSKMDRDGNVGVILPRSMPVKGFLPMEVIRIRGKFVDAAAKAAGLENVPVISYGKDGANKVERGSDGRFPDRQYNTWSIRSSEVLMDAAFKQVMSNARVQFLAANHDLIRNPKNPEAKFTNPVTKQKDFAGIDRNGVAFVDAEGLKNRVNSVNAGKVLEALKDGTRRYEKHREERRSGREASDGAAR